MRGISSHGKESIAQIVEDIFDKIALQYIGNIPRLQYKKRLIMSTQPNYGLAHLFVQSMNNQAPNIFEQDALKSMLESSFGFIESLKNRTKANVAESLDGLIKEAKTRGDKVSEEELQRVVEEEMKKAKIHLKTIAEAEGTKLRNAGAMMDISRNAAGIGDSDPTVFFIVIRDDATCKECVRLHLQEDGITPRVYKFSDLKQGYHKRGEDKPSAFGLHPHCRCTLTYLSKGFGFKDGKVTYVSSGHDQYSSQE